MLSRRRFLQVGLAGTAVLAAGYVLTAGRGTAAGFTALDAGSAKVVEGLIPVVLEGALPPPGPDRQAAISRLVPAFDRAVSGLTPAVRNDVTDLLGLLAFAPSRLMLAGILVPFESASAQDIAAFLTRWRTSRFDLLRAGYQALTQLIQAAWYDDPAAWPAIGYPGPPKIR